MSPITLVLGGMLCLALLCLFAYFLGKLFKALGDDTTFCSHCDDDDVHCPVCRNAEGL